MLLCAAKLVATRGLFLSQATNTFLMATRSAGVGAPGHNTWNVFTCRCENCTNTIVTITVFGTNIVGITLSPLAGYSIYSNLLAPTKNAGFTNKACLNPLPCKTITQNGRVCISQDGCS